MGRFQLSLNRAAACFQSTCPTSPTSIKFSFDKTDPNSQCNALTLLKLQIFHVQIDERLWKQMKKPESDVGNMVRKKTLSVCVYSSSPASRKIIRIMS